MEGTNLLSRHFCLARNQLLEWKYKVETKEQSHQLSKYSELPYLPMLRKKDPYALV